jgi:hypothetical protein
LNLKDKKVIYSQVRLILSHKVLKPWNNRGLAAGNTSVL